jgi:hypothetical protein
MVRLHDWWRERRNRTGAIRDVLAKSEQPSRLDRLDGRGTTASRSSNTLWGEKRPASDSSGCTDEAPDR